MDRITISNLEIFAYHGVLKEENALGQKFLISAELYTDILEAADGDDITKSINYASVCKTIEAFLKEHTYKLIETTADRLAIHLLKTYDRIEKIRLEIKKPWAPIHMTLDTVSVIVERGWHNAYLGIGSNLGDKETNLNEAVRLLNEDADCIVKQVSSYQVTEPVGGVEQDDFLNGAVCVKTLKSADALLQLIGNIEKALKRERIIHWGPRTIDLDILFYDDEVIQTKNLTIPHPEVANRRFVLDPMCEIAPWLRHPVLGETMLQLRDKL
ncbi:MAG: 2-amino-4-hydroxy-6-hydroxymethyldihydropteridine diphosphokinase [Lachnospiraceae bacterium]|jgi:dihydroneopterin aldolase/2-amino-4-hydroxy-6-hydroxymethyldihydropteridine diphosphokinase|nr:2-amino-4-hydroxy-6-hydroxymethyldihydropteridine diphosphokinase [Lachnospiraceae bacterium]